MKKVFFLFFFIAVSVAATTVHAQDKSQLEKEREEIKRQIDEIEGAYNEIKGQKKGHNQTGNDTDDIGALKMAIGQEEEAQGFYRDAGMKTDDPQGKILYFKLVEMEGKHLTILKAEFDSLSNSGYWCDFPEFTMESME